MLRRLQILRRRNSIDPFAHAHVSVRLAKIDDGRRLARIDVLQLLPLILHRIDPRDVASREHLPRTCDGACKAVTRSWSYQRIVEVWRNKVRYRHSIDRVRILIVFRRIASLDEVPKLPRSVLYLAAVYFNSDRRLYSVPIRIDQHLQRLVARGDRPALVVRARNHLRVWLFVLVHMKAAFAWWQALHQLNRPDTSWQFLWIRQIHHGSCDRPELRQVAGYLNVQGGSHGLHQLS